MNCPSCGAPLHLRPGDVSLVCDYCRRIFVPDANDEGIRILEEQTDMLCPACQAALSHASLSEQPVDFCRSCRGILFKFDRLETLIESVSLDGALADENTPPDRSQLSRKLICPSCHRPMQTHPYYGGGHVVIDGCEGCSLIWLDRGEIKRIALAVRTQ